MPVTRAFCAAFLLAACATPSALPEPEGADRLDETITAKVREGRDAGYPNLADVPTPAAAGEAVGALEADAARLETEADVLKSMRQAAADHEPDRTLERRGAALKREIEARRAEVAAQPPIERPAPR